MVTGLLESFIHGYAFIFPITLELDGEQQSCISMLLQSSYSGWGKVSIGFRFVFPTARCPFFWRFQPIRTISYWQDPIGVYIARPLSYEDYHVWALVLSCLRCSRGASIALAGRAPYGGLQRLGAPSYWESLLHIGP